MSDDRERHLNIITINVKAESNKKKRSIIICKAKCCIANVLIHVCVCLRERGNLTFLINTVQVFNKTRESISNFYFLPTINHKAKDWTRQ